jgi:glucosamine--fructose-6-phosphate aminotransferase (isomerizing)
MNGPEDSIVRAEIAEQREVAERLLDTQGAAFERIAGAVRSARPAFILIAARGSSDNVARYAQHLFGRLGGLPVALATPSLYTLYGTPPLLRDAFVIGISQSGASPDIRAVVETAARQGQPTAVVTNDASSPLAAAADHVIDLGAGVEASVAATKTYTASLIAIAALVAAAADDRELGRQLSAIGPALGEQLARAQEAAAAGEWVSTWRQCTVVGRGAQYPTAFEAALKVRELTGIPAEPFSPADLMHGPVAVLGEDHPVIAIAATGPTLEGVRETVAAARARGAPVVAVTDRPDAFADADATLSVVPVPEWLSPIVSIVPLQLLAVAAAERLGVDVDRPFGLTKVTQTT